VKPIFAVVVHIVHRVPCLMIHAMRIPIAQLQLFITYALAASTALRGQLQMSHALLDFTVQTE
jgi:hypothetical protein